MLGERVFSVPNVQIWAVVSINEVDLLMLRNRVFRLKNFQKWAMTTPKGVDLLMLRNRVFSLWDVQMPIEWTLICQCSGIAFSDIETFMYVLCRPTRWSICWCSGIKFSNYETIRYGLCQTAWESTCWLLGKAVPVIRILHILTVSSRKMGPIPDAHYSRFQGAKISNTGSAVQQWCWNADAQESRIQSAKFSEREPSPPKGVVLLMIRNRDFRLRITQIWVMLSCMVVD